MVKLYLSLRSRFWGDISFLLYIFVFPRNSYVEILTPPLPMWWKLEVGLWEVTYKLSYTSSLKQTLDNTK